MFTLKSVALTNFGAIRDSTFVPSEDGVTSIYGANGNGKSSFLDAVIWALFGTVPKDKKQIDMRNFSATEKEKTQVTVVFAHNGDTITVTRTMSAKGTATAEVIVNDEKLTKTTPTTAVNWVKKRLGINEEGFTKAFAIKQKQLDDLVSAPPTKRREIIERISGIERLSLALKYAKEAEKTSKTVFENTDNMEALIAEKNEELDTLTASRDDADSALEEASAEAHMLSRTKAETYESWQELVMAQNTYQKSRTRLTELEHARSLVESQKSNNESFLASLKKDGVGDASSLQADLEEINAKLEKLGEESTALYNEDDRIRGKQSQQKYERENHENRIRGFDADIAKLTEAVKDAKNTGKPHTSKDIEKVRKEQEKASAERDNQSKSIGLYENLIESTHTNIDLLSSHDTSECPTCHQHIEHPSELRESFEKSLADYEKGLAEARTALDKASEKLHGSQREEASMNEHNERVRQAQERHASLTQELEDKKEAKKSAENELASIPTVDYASQIESVNKRIRENTRQGQEALEHERNLKEAVKSLDKITELEQDIAEQEDKLEELGSEIDDFELPESVDDEQVNALKSQFDALTQSHENAKAQEDRQAQEVHTLQAAMTRVQQDIDQAQQQQEKYVLAKKDYDQCHAVSHLLSEFRKNTISRIAPEIAASTSAVVSSMTSDEFTGILLDEEFTPTVVRANGRHDPMHLLSGGEQSLVALALLIGIGDLLSGGSGGLLWLDEALVSQDANRRNLIASTLRNLPDRQLVMVNHTPDGNDLSDMVVELVKGEKGSYLRYDS